MFGKIKENFMIILLVISIIITSAYVYKLREDVKMYKWYGKLKEKELEKVVKQFSDPSLIIITLDGFNEKFIHFDKLKNDKMRQYIASAFFEYKKILILLNKKTDIDPEIIEEINDQEKFLCEQYDCSEFKESEPEKKGSPKK